MASTSPFSIPEPLRNILARFPLHTYPSTPSPYHAPRITEPTLWIHQPRSHLDTSSKQRHYEPEGKDRQVHESDVLSSDVECLKWQAYIALRKFDRRIAVRWDVSPDGGVDGRLPNLHVPIDPTAKGSEANIKDDGEGELLAAQLIPEWVDRQLGDVGTLEGYLDESARDESRAWVSLLEGNVHAALVCLVYIHCNLNANPELTYHFLLTLKLAFEPHPRSLLTLLTPYQSTTARPIEAVLSIPPAPLTGWSTLFRPYGTHLDLSSIELKYKEAIAALSDRLATDRWLLGSSAPTALDALAFAYLHTILDSNNDTLRFEVSRRVNLVAWEQRVSRDVKAAFKLHNRP
ncbi:hypothetical protein BC835DRAFT_1409993 [Cytidiella melzeri]|nr:hypothetical protein BC835DRAFT_1409993 [Cytidiella melzeri]